MVSATPWTFSHMDSTWTVEVEGNKLHVTADCPEPWWVTAPAVEEKSERRFFFRRTRSANVQKDMFFLCEKRIYLPRIF